MHTSSEVPSSFYSSQPTGTLSTFRIGLGPQVNFCGTTLTNTQTIKIYCDTYFKITEKIKIFIVSLAHLYSFNFTNLLYKMLT